MPNVAKTNKIRNLVQNKQYLLLLIIIFGFLIRFYFVRILPVNLDEGNYLYDANLILKGEVPFRDFMAREPIYFYILAFFTRLFGADIIVSRGISLISSIGVMYLTYKIGQELYGNTIGLIASSLFAFSPFIIYYNLTGNISVFYLLIITISFYYLILAFKNNNYRYYLFFGLLLGASILTYRLSTIFFLTLPFLFVIVMRGKPLKEIFWKTLIAYTGITLSLIPTLAYFIAVTNFKWMNFSFGADKILLAYASFMPILLSSYFLYYYVIRKYNSLSKFVGILLAVGLIYYFFAYVGVPFSNKARIFYGITLESLYLLAPTFLFLSYYSTNALFKNKRLNEKIFLAIGIFIIYFLFSGMSANPYSNVVNLENNLEKVFIILIVVSIMLVLYFVDVHENLPELTNFSNIFLTYIFISLIAFNLGYSQWIVGYFLMYAVIVSLMSAVVLAKIYKWHTELHDNISKTMKIVFIVFILSSAIFSQVKYATTPDPDRGWKLTAVEEVSNHIASNTEYNEKIFTAGTIFAVYAKRDIIFNISHPLLYLTPSGNATKDPFSYDPYNLYPSISEIIDYLEKNKIKYIVADIRTADIFLSQKNPNLRDYIYKNYYIEKTIDNVNIYKRFVYKNSTYGGYSENFDSDKWKRDSQSFYGIGWRADWSSIYPALLGQHTYLRYNFNFEGYYENILLELTGNRRDLRNNLTIYISSDNSSYIKLIEFDKVENSFKKVNVTDYIKNNQTWIEFRFYQSNKSDGIPRILDFSITATPIGNETIQVIPSEKPAVLSKKNVDYNTANLVIESSFEHYKDLNNPPIAWSFTSNNGGVSQIDTIAFNGNYSYRVNVKNATNGTADMSQTIDINRSMPYKLSTAYNQLGSGGALVVIQWFDENQNKVGEDKLDLNSSNVWNNASVERVTPPNTKHGKIILRYLTNKGDTGTVWFDDVKLLLASGDQS